MNTTSSRREPIKRIIGDALGFDGDVVRIRVRCDCDHEQTVAVDGGVSTRRQLAEESCRSCGRLGRMRAL